MSWLAQPLSLIFEGALGTLPFLLHLTLLPGTAKASALRLFSLSLVMAKAGEIPLSQGHLHHLHLHQHPPRSITHHITATPDSNSVLPDWRLSTEQSLTNEQPESLRS